MESFNYDEHVAKYSNSFRRVLIDEEYLARIKAFAKKVIDAKAVEHHHLLDHGQELKRFTTGLMGEAALEKLLGIDIIDWTIGNSNHYHIPDIPGYEVGIKTVEKGKFPIIFKRNHYPQIICIKSDYKENLVFVCGLASPNVLNRYQSDRLVLSPNLLKRGTKTGFWGFQYLTPISSIEDICQYKKSK